MPASRLTRKKIPIHRCDVVGCDARDVTNFICHVALSASDHVSVGYGDSIHVNHMGPPLERNHNLEVHVYAYAKLDDDELKQIELFIDEHNNEQEAQKLREFDSYIVHPHTKLSPDGSYRLFSCAGFVLEAYREAGIDLIDMTGVLPSVDLQILKVAYPEIQNSRSRLRISVLEKLGLRGNGPWPVLLPGYIFHSMARAEDVIRSTPYRPTIGDEEFPRA